MAAEEKTDMLAAATWYAKHGWPVFPCNHHTKRPITKHGFHEATKDLKQIASWWKRYPDAAIGISPGPVGIAVIDVDVKPDVDGNETLEDLEKKYGRLPDTVEQITGGGGRQLFFTTTMQIPSLVNFAPGIDTRSTGGYVIVPPSLHPSGNRYEWEVSSKPHDTPLAALPPAWVKAFTNGKKKPSIDAKQRTPTMDSADVLAGVAEGARDDTLFRYACRLRTKGFSYAEAKTLVLTAANACTPPFPEDEALKKISQAWKYQSPSSAFDDLQTEINNSIDFHYLITDLPKRVGAADLEETATHVLQKQIVERSKQLNPACAVTLQSVRKVAETSRCKRDEPTHLENAILAINHLGGYDNLIETNNTTWKWRNPGGVWEPVDDRVLNQAIHAVLGKNKFTKTKVLSIRDLLKTEIFRQDHQWNADRRSINTLSGELHWTGTSWELKPHCREHFRTTQLPLAYDPRAKATRFEQFLDEVFFEDEDQEMKKQCVLEAIGYSLLSTCEYEKFFLLIGSGANGKSVLLYVLAALVGTTHAAAVQPSQLENRFQRAHLCEKLVNIVTEIAEGTEIADAALKAITSGELTTAEQKFKPPFEFMPFATCWFGANHMPHTRDFSDALFRRSIILTFNNKFEGKNCDENLKFKLVENELPGILNLALDALTNLLTTRKFTEPPSSLEAKDRWRVNCDQARQFAEDCCNVGPGLLEQSSLLYKKYREWAEENGIGRRLNQKNFSQRLFRLGCEPHKGTGGVRMISGIELKMDQRPEIWSR